MDSTNLFETIKSGDILINRHDGTKVLKVKDVTEKSIIIQQDKKKEEIVEKNSYLDNQYVKLGDYTLIEQPSDKLTKNDLSVGLTIELIFKSTTPDTKRTISYISEDYYLFTDTISSKEQKGNYLELSKYKKTIKTEEEIDPTIQNNISLYKESFIEVSNSLKNLIENHRQLQNLQNSKIKSKLVNSLIKPFFSEFESFCLTQSIPIPLSQEQTNHLKNNKISLVSIRGDEIPNHGFGGFDEEQEPRFIKLFKVFYFSDANFIEEVTTLLNSLGK